MSFLKLVMQAGPVKDFIAKYIKNLLYLKTGYHADLLLNEVMVKDENGKTTLHLNCDLNMNSTEFYELLNKLNE